MGVLSLSKVPELKREILNYGLILHTHDACGSQSFSLEKQGEKYDEKVFSFLDEYFKNEKLEISYFGKENLNFLVK